MRLARKVAFAIVFILIWVATCLQTVGVSLRSHPTAAQQLTMTGRDFSIRSGEGDQDAIGLVVTALGDDGTGLQTAGLGRVRSEQLPILRYRIRDFPDTLELAFVFRRTEAPDDVQTISLPAPVSPEGAVDLTSIASWQGEILEIGFAEYAAGQVVSSSRAKFSPFHIERVSLQAPSWSEAFPRLMTDWFAYRPWALLSISALGPQLETLPTSSIQTALAVGALFSLLAGWLILGWSRRKATQVALATVMLVWVMLDLRWLDDLFSKHRVIESLYAGKPWEDRVAIQPDEDNYAAARKIAEVAAEQKLSRVLVLGDSEYNVLRLVYFLLPLNATPLREMLIAAPDAPLPSDALIAVFDSASKYDPDTGLLHVVSADYPVTPILEKETLRLYRTRGAAP